MQQPREVVQAPRIQRMVLAERGLRDGHGTTEESHGLVVLALWWNGHRADNVVRRLFLADVS